MLVPRPLKSTRCRVICPAELGDKVTTCIAALCERRKTIVSVSDSKASFGSEHSADDAVPTTNQLIDNWSILYAGNQVADVDFVVIRARELLSNGLFPPDPLTVAKAVDTALAERLQEQIEIQVLRRYNLTADSFLNKGKLLLRSRLYNDICSAISKVSLSLDFIVCGFDENGDGHLVFVDGDSAPKSYDTAGFCAIGKGAAIAVSNLAFHREHSHLSVSGGLAECIYCCCAAKFMSESASDIGENTFLTVTRNGSPTRFISEIRIGEIREAWKKYGAPRVPPRILSKIPEMIHDREGNKTPRGLDKGAKRQKLPESPQKLPGMPTQARTRLHRAMVDDLADQTDLQKSEDQQ